MQSKGKRADKFKEQDYKKTVNLKSTGLNLQYVDSRFAAVTVAVRLFNFLAILGLPGLKFNKKNYFTNHVKYQIWQI
jgi:hypothetical protein